MRTCRVAGFVDPVLKVRESPSRCVRHVNTPSTDTHRYFLPVSAGSSRQMVAAMSSVS